MARTDRLETPGAGHTRAARRRLHRAGQRLRIWDNNAYAVRKC